VRARRRPAHLSEVRSGVLFPYRVKTSGQESDVNHNTGKWDTRQFQGMDHTRRDNGDSVSTVRYVECIDAISHHSRAIRTSRLVR
jgi:hypothetical protein